MPRSYLPAVHAALTLAMRHPPADPARHFSCLPSTLHFKMQSHADQARLLHRTTIALSQLHRLLQQATDVLANLHSLYLVHTRQVDPQLHRPFPPSPWMSVLDSPFTAPHFHQSQQTTPRPAIHHRHTQTDINGIVHLPAFAGIMATPPPEQSASSNTTANIPSTTSPSFTAAANKQPHERWQYVNLSPPLLSPLRHTLNSLRTSLPLLAAPRATSAPRPHHVPPPLPALDNQIHVLAPQFPPAQHHVQHHNNSFPPCNLFQNIPRQPCSPPTRLRPSTNPCRPFSHRMAHLPGSDSPTNTGLSTTPGLAPAGTRMAILLSCTTITAAASSTGSRIHHATSNHHTDCHSPASPATRVLRHAGAPLPLHLQNYEPEHGPLARRQPLNAPQL